MRQFDIAYAKEEMLDVVHEFPKIFLEPSKEVLMWFGNHPEVTCEKREDLVNLRFGFEHGSGWKEIVRGFCKDVQELSDRLQEKGFDCQYKGFIMKEKFGEFTPQGDWDGDFPKEYWGEYYDIRRKWEEISKTVCEETGKPGHLCQSDRGWMKTLCEEEMGDVYRKLNM